MGAGSKPVRRPFRNIGKRAPKLDRTSVLIKIIVPIQVAPEPMVIAAKY